jgi:hypothetical protein
MACNKKGGAGCWVSFNKCPSLGVYNMPSVAKKEWNLDGFGLRNVCEWVMKVISMQEVNSTWFQVSAPLIMDTYKSTQLS